MALAADTPYGVTVQTDVMVPMRDGVQLATDIYLPTKDGVTLAKRLPTILMRTPYNKSSGDKPAADALYFAGHGYAVVFQDTRGRYKSEGVWHWLTDDGRDGVDTAAWLARQPWSNGKLGTIGTSYVGGTQHALALERCPQLVTAIPVDAVCNMGYAGVRNGGAFELRFWNWITSGTAARGSRQSRDPATAAVLSQMSENRIQYLLQLPLRRGTTPLKLAPEYEDWLVEAMAHGANDDFWRQNNILDHADQYPDIPLYLVGGWYDSWGSNTAATYIALSRKIKGPVYLIMGPWIHGQQGKSSHGQVSFGPAAAIPDPLAWRRAWYDHWLKGVENEVGKAEPFAAPVRIFVMGSGDGRKTQDGLLNHGGSWRDEHEWPLARTQPTNYYLHAGGRIAANPPAQSAESTSFQFDPHHPVPTIGGNISSGDGILLQGAWDQRGGPHVWNFREPLPLSARNDVLVFQSEPLAGDLEVTGEIVVKLWASSSAVDTDFTAKLLDAYPPSPDFPGGFDLNIGDGILRARFRESLAKETLMRPGEIYPLSIKLYPTSNIFKRGHRIRVDLSSSNFPRFDLNPNTGEPLNDNRRMVIAINTIHHDREHPSHISLPVIPPADK
jgi:putative CocE/NonD family hydrolase